VNIEGVRLWNAILGERRVTLGDRDRRDAGDGREHLADLLGLGDDRDHLRPGVW
jgi:hypothetical protein